MWDPEDFRSVGQTRLSAFQDEKNGAVDVMVQDLYHIPELLFKMYVLI
jgi:hypothetical protein